MFTNSTSRYTLKGWILGLSHQWAKNSIFSKNDWFIMYKVLLKMPGPFRCKANALLLSYIPWVKAIVIKPFNIILFKLNDLHHISIWFIYHCCNFYFSFEIQTHDHVQIDYIIVHQTTINICSISNSCFTACTMMNWCQVLKKIELCLRPKETVKQF